MSLSRQETFHIEEYKSLREEMITKLKDRLEFNRWSMIGLAALYSYILANQEPMLFWVPVIFSIVVIWHLHEEHRVVARIADYVRLNLEPWLVAPRVAGVPLPLGPGGWETHLGSPGGGTSVWKWSPIPLWICILVFALLVAIAGELWPSMLAAPPSGK
jgi:hypothetical protein